MKVANVRTTETRTHWITKTDVEYGGELNTYLRDVTVRRGIALEIFRSQGLRLRRRRPEVQRHVSDLQQRMFSSIRRVFRRGFDWKDFSEIAH